MDNPHGTATVLFSLGKGQFLSGGPQRGRQSLERALAIFTDLGAPQAAEVRTYLEGLERATAAADPDRA
jgi:hypothetical protein